MKAYKGFNRDMTCRGYQYAEGGTYELPEGETPKLCENGFHACEAPIDCLKYYAPADSVYHEVELDGVTEETDPDDSKRVGSKIKIGARLDIAGIIKAQFAFAKEKCEKTESGGDMSALTGGDMSALTGGYRSALTGGYRSALTGGYMSALTGGDRSALTGGDRSVLRGGIDSRFKGGMWSVFACEIRNNNMDLIGVKAGVVDGETLKPGVWYGLKDGEFVEIE